ncbi:MAG: hypothetical protein ACI9GB_003604 [Halioglobus sp.]|jgi:hypothetical protein
MRQILKIASLCVVANLAATPASHAGIESIFSTSWADMVKGAAEFGNAMDNYNAAQGCAADPACESGGDTSSGFETGMANCCYDNDACYNEFTEYVRKIDVTLFTLYKNERTYTIFMRAQDARIAMMKGAASTSAAGTAIGGTLEADIIKARKKYVDKFNATTDHNIDRLNEFLIGLNGTLGQYCETNNWYQINGLPIYIHAKTKFPK